MEGVLPISHAFTVYENIFNCKRSICFTSTSMPRIMHIAQPHNIFGEFLDMARSQNGLGDTYFLAT